MNEYSIPTKAPDTIRSLNITLPVSSSLRQKNFKGYYKRKKIPMTIRISPEIFGRIMIVVDQIPGLAFSRFCEDSLKYAMQKLKAKSDRHSPLRMRFKAKRKCRVDSINLVV